MKKISTWVSLLAIGAMMSACLDDDSGMNTIPEEIGWLAFINASPDSERLHFYNNDKIQNNEGIAYGKLFGYVHQDTGLNSIRVRSSSSQDLDTLNINLKKGDLYSIYAVNTFDKLKLMMYSDQHILPDNEHSMMRFIQLSPDAPHIKLNIEGEAVEFGDFEFMESSPFIAFKGGYNKKLHLIDLTTNDTILTSTLNFQRGKSYSVFSKGLMHTTDMDEQLDIQVIPFQ